VAEDLKIDGTTETAPYITTQIGRKRKGMAVLIGADHGKGAWRSHIKVFTRDGKYHRLFREQRKHEQKEAVAERGY
jgi:hypothetical protein